MPTLQVVQEGSIRYPVFRIWDKDCLLVEALDKFHEGLLRPLLDLRQVDAGPPFLPIRDELAEEFVGQIL